MSLLALPDQTIPEIQKDKDWHIKHCTEYAIYSLSDHYTSQKLEMRKLYRGYNAELDAEETKLTKAITCPHGGDLGVEYVVYPLIQQKIEQIVGEFLLRPLRRQAYVLDKKSQNAKFEEKLKMVSEELMRDVTKKLQDEMGYTPETENPEIQLPDDIEEFFEKDFKMIAEVVANNLISLFLDVRKEKHKLKELFVDYCITDRAHAVLDKKHGHTTMRKVHPLDADYDVNPYSVVQDNHEFFFENYYLTENEVYNSFTLDNKQKSLVKEMFETMGDYMEGGEENSMAMSSTLKYDGWVDTSNKTGRIRLVSAMWKSRRRTTIKVTKNNKTGKEIYKKVDDEKNIRKNDKAEHIDAEMPRFCIMLGPDLVLDWGEMDHRYSTVENKYECTLPVVSIIRDNSTGTSNIKSVAAKLYQLQQIASEVLYEIRLALKSAGNSRVLVYDVAQTPKDFSKGGFENGLNRVMTHIKKDKLMLINSKDKGAGKNTFNQFTSLDLSQKGAIQDLFNGLAIIEDLASKFVGISPEREGKVGQYQTAGGTDAAIRGSAARTEVIYTPFDEFIQALLEKVMIKMKYDYEPGGMLQYIFGEFKTKMIPLYKEFFEADLGIYLSDARKDKEASERINAAAELALSNAAGSAPEMIMGLIEIFEGESATEKKAVFGRMLNSMEKLRKEQEAAQQQAGEAAAKAEEAKQKEETQLKREGYENNIDVAEIYVKGKGMADTVKALSQEKIKRAELESNEVEKPSATQ